MIGRMFVGAGLLIGLISPAAAQEKLVFHIIDVAIEAPIPVGYCLPTGKDRAAADLLAAADTNNVTHAMLVRCDRMVSAAGLGNDYLLFKTPRTALVASLPRAELLAVLAAEYGKAEWQSGGAALEKTMGDVSNDISETFNTPVEVKTEIAPRGADADCAYLGGEATVSGAGVNYPIQVGACTTTAGNKVLTVYAYDDPKGPNGIVRLMRKARDLAMSFVPAAKGVP